MNYSTASIISSLTAIGYKVITGFKFSVIDIPPKIHEYENVNLLNWEFGLLSLFLCTSLFFSILGFIGKEKIKYLTVVTFAFTTILLLFPIIFGMIK